MRCSLVQLHCATPYALDIPQVYLKSTRAPSLHSASLLLAQRWSDQPFKKNAGLAYYSNGSLLPHEARYRKLEKATLATCQARALETFSAYRGLGADELRRDKLKVACARLGYD